MQRKGSLWVTENKATFIPVVDAGGEFSRERGGSESIRDPRGVPERDSSDGVGDPTDILAPHPNTTCKKLLIKKSLYKRKKKAEFIYC